MTSSADGAAATITVRTPSPSLAAKQALLAAVAGDDGVRAVVGAGVPRP